MSASGLISGDSKTNCIYVDYSDYSFAPALAAAEAATGVNYNCLSTYIDADPTWTSWESPWITNPNYGWTSWLAADPTQRQLVIGMDLIPDSVCASVCANPLSWEETCDTGAYDSYATTLAQNLVDAGMGDSVIRLGLEMNGSWENDYTGSTTTELEDWATCFDHEVTAMRSVSGANFLFDWNPNACVNDYPLADFYPGNAYVNIIGVDQYDAFCNGTAPTPSAATFASLAAEPDGLNAVAAFAEQEGIPMSLPEWGTEETPSGLGDDGSYVTGVGQWVAANDVAFQTYFDVGDDGILTLGAGDPNTLAAYVSAFG